MANPSELAPFQIKEVHVTDPMIDTRPDDLDTYILRRREQVLRDADAEMRAALAEIRAAEEHTRYPSIAVPSSNTQAPAACSSEPTDASDTAEDLAVALLIKLGWDVVPPISPAEPGAAARLITLSSLRQPEQADDPDVRALLLRMQAVELRTLELEQALEQLEYRTWLSRLPWYLRRVMRNVWGVR